MVGKERVSAPYRALGLPAPPLVLVGPTTRNQASDESGRPTGHSAPANPQPPEPEDGFVCEFPGCGRTFPTIRGRGVHHQRAHKDWYDARANVPSIKVRWTAEESAMLAHKEMELLRAGPPRFMNQELMQYFPQRTLESIKGRRRQQDHKRLVATLMKEEEAEDPASNDEPPEEENDTILVFLESLPRPVSDGFRGLGLYGVIREARRSGKAATLQKLALYLREIFPPPRNHPARPARKTLVGNTNKREARKKEYAETQNMWKKNRGRCITAILENLATATQPPREIMEPYWTKVMTTTSNVRPNPRRTETIEAIWRPITIEDLKEGRIPRASAPGPDGVSAGLFRSIPSNILVMIYNTIMWCEGLPEDMLLSRTTFIPKNSNAKNPGDFRPITIPPVLVRGLHKILAKRLEQMLEIDQRQRAFRSTDGCADNTFLLDTLLRYHRGRFRSLYLASLDISKAFDSVSHEAILMAMGAMGVPSPMIRYLRMVYGGSCTRLEGDGWTSRNIHPTRGVRQGDPLSPVIFSIITHLMLKNLPREAGVQLGNSTINAAAFADDVLLFASSQVGLQRLVDGATGFSGECGMSINTQKSFTIAIKALGHLKKTVIDATAVITCAGQVLPALSRSVEWRYLGVRFTAEGRTKITPSTLLEPLLAAITRAPLKPQQRLFALRTIIIPKVYHQLALGAVTIGTLNKTDKIVRNAIRRWMALPHDVPTAYFHATTQDGGLGIQALRWLAPLQRRGRLLAIMKTDQGRELVDFLGREIAVCERRLTDHGKLLNTAKMLHARWSEKLYQSVDGAGLKDSNRTPHQHRWVSDGTRLLSGKDYINCNRLRISALPTKSRSSRGRIQDRRCRAGCAAQETLNHILQQCHRTHAVRIKRHDAILTYMERRIKSAGYEIHKEPRYRTIQGVRKPDLVAKLGQTAVVVDAQVVGEQADLATAHSRKIRYYSEQHVTDVIKQEHNVRNVIVTSATLTWKGVWGHASAASLRNLGFTTSEDEKIISTRVLIGGIAEYRTFNATTSVTWRAGIG